MRLSIILAVGIFAALTAPKSHGVTPAELEKAIQLPVEKFQLKNGLTVLLHPDTSIPAVSVHTWFRVGSKDEQVGLTGLAHFFEHMMFKGTSKFPKDTWGKFMNSKGAEVNAFTSSDYTGYYVNAPSEHLKLILEIEADRMRNLTMDQKEVTSEREVVKEERRMRYDDSIEGGIREKMSELMFKELPYRWLPIGFMADLNAATMPDLLAFYKSFYSPNNAVLVITGSFDPSQAKRMIERTHGGLPREQVNRPAVKPESPQTEERRASIEREAQAPSLAVGYRLPDMRHKDNYAMDLLSIIVGQGQSSRLHKELVYKRQVALSAGSYSWSQLLASQFVVQVGLKPGQSADATLGLIEQELAKLRNQQVTQKELDKARNIFMKDYVDSLKRISGRARILASYEILFDDYTRLYSDLREYHAVTAADIQRVAKLYLNPKQRNIVIVNPKKATKGTT